MKPQDNSEVNQFEIRTGRYKTRKGYLLKIIDKNGKTVFETPVEKDSYKLDSSMLSEAHKYLLQVLDNDGNIMYMEKIHRKDSICI